MHLLNKLFSSLSIKSSDTNPSSWFEIGFFGSTRKRTLKELYSGITFSCIDAIASNTASIPLHLYKNDGDGNPDEVLDHPILTPLNRANNQQTGADVIYLISSFIDLHGKAYVWPRKNLRGYPMELWVIDPTMIKVAVNKREFPYQITGYVFQDGNVRVPFDVTELIPIVRPNVFNPIDGVSTIEMARRSAEVDLDAQDYNTSFFKRGARPDGILTTDQGISDTSFERLKKQWEQYEGKDAKRTLILENNLKYQQLALNQKDMDFIEQRRFSRDEIMSIFRVPKSILAISDDVNRANAEAGEYIFAKYTLVPRVRMIVDRLNQFYVPMFPQSQQLLLKYDSPVPEDEEKASRIRMGELYQLRTLNETRSAVNLPSVGKEGDQLYTPFNLMPIGSGQQTNEDEDPEDDNQVEKTLEEKLSSYVQKGIVVKSAESRFIQASQTYLQQREKQMISAIRQLYADVIVEIRKADGKKEIVTDPDLILSYVVPKLDSFTNLTTSIVLKYNTQTFRIGLEKLSEYYELPFSFDLVNAGAVQHLELQARKTAESIRDGVLNTARKAIAEQLGQSGFTIDKAKKAVIRSIKEETAWKAERIARTEVNSSYNEANYRAYKDSQIVKQVKWITSKDPCELCVMNHGKIVSVGQPFPSGHTHPIVHPNCTCGIAPYFGV